MAKRKKKVKGGSAVKLVRRRRDNGEISPRKRGRPHPDFETGYLDSDGNFQAGNPPARRGRRRRRGRGPGRPKGSGRKGVRSVGVRAAAGSSDLAAIEAIVRREVDARLSRARAAAIAALSKALV